MDVDEYAGREGMLALFEECMRLAAADDLDALMVPLTVKARRTHEKHEIPRIASAALASVGKAGVRRLSRVVSEEDLGGLRALAALRALWMASTGKNPMVSSLGIPYREISIDEETQTVARLAVDDFIVDALENAERFRLLVSFQESEMIPHLEKALPTFNAHVVDVLRESSIVLTDRLIKEFEDLVLSNAPEAHYQSFLEENPVFLDPLAAEVFNRKRLGEELVTDFVVRRHDGLYVVVEIEKPQDRLFTGGNDLSASFTHASGQVLDFQGWVAENVAYAQKSLPGIESPRGLVIMGRRSDLTEQQGAKLRRWVGNSRNIEVSMFDDLVVTARALHASLRRAPIQ